MIVTLLIASLAVVLRIIRQARWKRTRLNSRAPCGMHHPSPAARAIRNNPAPRTTAPMARTLLVSKLIDMLFRNHAVLPHSSREPLKLQTRN